MKTITFYTFVFASILFFSSCQKKPVASFTSDKETYSVGEYLNLSNDSKDADYFQWVIKGPNDEKREISENPQIQLKNIGTYEITLLCYSRNRNLSDVFTKTVTVENKDGFYTFYTNDLIGSTINIYIDNIYSGAITNQTIGTPTCGQAGCLTIPITPGYHEIKAVLISFSIANYYNIVTNSNNCNLIYVDF